MEAAFFDLDKTVIAKASIAAYIPTLRRAGYLTAGMALRAAWGHLLFRFFGADEDSLNAVRRTALRLATGLNQTALRRLARDNLTDVIEPIVYDDALDLFERHRSEGRLLVLVSASPTEIVEPLAEHLGVDRFIATTPVIDPEGRYTGEVEFYAYGEAKAEAIRRLGTDLDLDLGRSWAYSDSATDLPMLKSVGRPVAVNPDRELRQTAEAEGWTILEFDRPVALGDRVPLNRDWVVAAMLTTVAGFGVVALARRFRQSS